MAKVFWLISLLMACDSGAVAEAPKAVVDAAKVTEGLKIADAADGTEDKVVHKCAGCSLGMDGNKAHTITHQGYELHMCSAACKSKYEKDLPSNLAKLAD